MEKFDFAKKFSIGINSAISWEDYDVFFNKFSTYIDSVYFSLPLGYEYSTRYYFSENLKTKEQLNNFDNIISLLDKYGIKKEIALNTYNLSKGKLDRAIEYMKTKVYPDEIVCLKEYIDYIKEKIPHCKFIYSFNNYDLENIPDSFDEIVLGREFLFNKNKRDSFIADKHKIRLLLNNGCSLKCHACIGGDYCENLFKKDVKEKGINQVYAEQSFFPIELHELLNTDNNVRKMKFKLSTRHKSLIA